MSVFKKVVSMVLVMVFMWPQIATAQNGYDPSAAYLYPHYIPDDGACAPAESAVVSDALKAGDSLYIIGDSITVGLRDFGEIASKLEAKDIVVTGISAEVSQPVTWAESQIAANGRVIADSDALLIGLGTNNIGDVVKDEAEGGGAVSGGKEALAAKIQSVIDTVRANGQLTKIYWTSVYVTGTLETDFGTFDMDHARTIINEAIYEVADRNQINIVDWNNYSLAPSIVKDGIHPNGATYPEMADFVVNSLTTSTNTPTTSSSACQCSAVGSFTSGSGSFSAEVYGTVKELPADWVPILAAAANEFGVDPGILAALLANETNWNSPDSFASNPMRNSATATGPFQFLDSTMRDFADEPDQWSNNSDPHTSRIPKIINNGSSTILVGGASYHLADGNRDGKVDRATPEDAAFLAAIYIKYLGATTNTPLGTEGDYSVPKLGDAELTVRHIGAYYNQGQNFSAPTATSEADVDSLAVGGNHVGRYMDMMSGVTNAARQSGVFGSVSTTCTTLEGSGLVDPDGYAFPLAPQTQAVGGISVGQTTPTHHDGTAAYDLFSTDSASVYAIYDGTVVRVNTNYKDQVGCSTIQFKADDGYYYWYGHLKNVIVNENEKVTAGTKIAELADDQNFTSACWGGAPHLHIDRGCVVDGVPQPGGYDNCRDPSFIEFLSKLYERLPS